MTIDTAMVDKVLARMEFVPVLVDTARGEFANIHQLYQVMPLMADYADHFWDDSVDARKEYGTWLQLVMEFIEACDGWFYIASLDGEPQSVVWVNDFAFIGRTAHTCWMGGATRRKADPVISQACMRWMLQRVFEQTDVYIVRALMDEDNRAARMACWRGGFSHPETLRAYRIKRGRERTGIIMSITRPEFDAR